MLSLSKLLAEAHWLVILFGTVLCILSVLANRRLNEILLTVYIVFMLYMTFVGERGENGRLELTIFWSYRQFFENSSLRMQIINNIWLYIPFGTMLYKLYPKIFIVLIAASVSCVIELLQYILKAGLCELDDVVSNTIGCLIGILIYIGISKWIEYRKMKEARLADSCE